LRAADCRVLHQRLAARPQSALLGKEKNDRNEASGLMVYALAYAYYLGLHKKNAAQWKQVREFVDPDTPDLSLNPASIASDAERSAALLTSHNTLTPDQSHAGK
jgi:phage terminase large subunit GpA-like protein